MEIQNPSRQLRFWTKVLVDLPDRCWNWLGAKDQKGYGNFYIGRRKYTKAHIFSYLLHHGFIPDGLQVDHECNNTSCVNPLHLRLLTGLKNNERSNSPSAINKRKTHCKRGHLLSGDNIIRKNGRRICISCEKERGRI
jgi:hypothetical protein